MIGKCLYSNWGINENFVGPNFVDFLRIDWIFYFKGTKNTHRLDWIFIFGPEVDSKRMDFKFEFFHFGLDSEKNAPGSHPWMMAIP